MEEDKYHSTFEPTNKVFDALLKWDRFLLLKY